MTEPTYSLDEQLIRLFSSATPIGTTQALLNQLREEGSLVGDAATPKKSGVMFGALADLLRKSELEDEDDENEDQHDEDEKAYDENAALLRGAPPMQGGLINPVALRTTWAQLKFLQQVWNHLAAKYEQHNLEAGEKEMLGILLDFLFDDAFVAKKELAEKFSKELIAWQKEHGFLPKEVFERDYNPMMAFENTYINGVLRSERHLFSKTYPSVLKDFLTDTLARNVELYEHINSLFPQAVSDTNIDWFVQYMDATEAQQKTLKYFLQMNLANSVGKPDVIKQLEQNSSFKPEVFYGLMDQAFDLPARTSMGVFKPDASLVHRLGLTDFDNGWRDNQPLTSLFKRNVLRELSTYYAERLDLMRNITTDTLEEIVPDQTLQAEDFAHVGLDVTNLITAMREKEPMKILIVGKPGSGKKALVEYAIAQAKRGGITINSDNLEDYNIRMLRSMAPLMGKPVMLLNGFDTMNTDTLTSLIRSKSKTFEVWVCNNISSIHSSAMSSFDMVIDVPSLPYEKRVGLAKNLFKNDLLANKVAKVCSTPGEIMKLHRWSTISGQTSWKELSVVANNIVQAGVKTITDSNGKTLPVVLHQPSETNNGFEHVVGCDGIVKQARKMIAGYHHPETFKKVGAKPPKGILLTGGPGLGKTYLVKAMAHEAGVPLIIASSSSLSRDPNMISSVFAEARRQAPCILFLDEIDAVGAKGKNPDGSAADPERQAILNRLLTEIDGFEGLSDVMVIGATHRADVLDEALTRSGRLGWKINFNKPDKEARASLWRFYTQSIPTDSNIDWNRVSRLSVGMSPADIHEAVNIASLNAAFESQEKITEKHLEKAIDQVEWGVTDENKSVIEKELYRTAIHEAGHAVMSQYFDLPLERASVMAHQNTLGFVQPMLDEDKIHSTEHDLFNQIKVLFAGRLAEKVCLNSRSLGAESDLFKIRTLVQTMCRDEGMGALEAGMDYAQASPDQKKQIEESEHQIIKKCHDEALAIMQQHAVTVKRLAELLVKERELDYQDIKTFFAQHPTSENSVTEEAVSNAPRRRRGP